MEDQGTYEDPSSLEEADQLRRELTLDIQSIQQQLGDKQRTDENGNRLSRRDYWGWRKKAQFVLNQKLAELRHIKAWIKDNRPVLNPFILSQAREHLRNLIEILAPLNDESVLDEDAETRFEKAQAFLNGLG